MLFPDEIFKIILKINKEKYKLEKKKFKIIKKFLKKLKFVQDIYIDEWHPSNCKTYEYYCVEELRFERDLNSMFYVFNDMYDRYTDFETQRHYIYVF